MRARMTGYMCPMASLGLPNPKNKSIIIIIEIEEATSFYMNILRDLIMEEFFPSDDVLKTRK